MNLTAFRIANFKAFAASQRIPLRPITLIYGANSAGKSSVLHALALAHHAIETGDLDTQRTQIGGETIDLGGFRQYVHRRERGGQVQLEFELDPGLLSGRVAELLRTAREIVVELAIGEGIASEQLPLFGDRSRVFDREGGIRVERFELEVDRAPLLSMSAREGGLLRLDRLDHSHPVFRELFRAILMLATTTQTIHERDFDALGEVLDTLVPGIAAKNSGLFPRIEEEAEDTEEEVEGWEAFLPVSRGQRMEDLARAARLFVPKTLRDLVGGLGAAVEDEIRQLRYLGPLRSYPPRHLAFSQHHDPNWFAGGGYAWDVVRTNPEVRHRVNEWLGDSSRLKTPYELVVRDLLPVTVFSSEIPAKLHKALHDLVASLLEEMDPEKMIDLSVLAGQIAERIADLDPDDPDDIIPEIEELVSAASDEEALSERWAEELVEARPEALQDLVLIDKRTGTPVSHRDVGIGVSQVLPGSGLGLCVGGPSSLRSSSPRSTCTRRFRPSLAMSLSSRPLAEAATPSSSRPTASTCCCGSCGGSGKPVQANCRTELPKVPPRGRDGALRRTGRLAEHRSRDAPLRARRTGKGLAGRILRGRPARDFLMPLLADYAITPDVFDVTSYSSGEVCSARLETIREAMLTEGLFRNLERRRVEEIVLTA